MSQRKKAVLSLVSLLMLGVVSLFAGCGHTGEFDPPPTVAVAGKVVMGPVSGAKVCADLNANRQCDIDEPFAITDAFGNFNFRVLVSSGSTYNLLSVGGTDTLTGKPAPTMRAPSDARNITPVTDLVVQSSDPAATKAMLNALFGGNYDADISDPAGVSPELMKLVKSIETTLAAFTQTLGVTDTDQLDALINAIADALTTSTETDIDLLLSDSFYAATFTTVSTLAFDDSLFLGTGSPLDISFGVAAIATLVSDYVDEVTTAVSAAPVLISGNVVENFFLQSLIAAGVATVDTTQVTAIVQNVLFTFSALKAYDVNGRIDTLDGNGNPVIPSSVDEISVAVVALNDFDSQKSYTVQVKLSIDDINNGRQVNFLFSGVNLVVAAGPSANALVSLPNTATSSMTVEAWKSDGTQIVTNAVTQSFASEIYINSNEVYFNLASIETILETQVSTEFASFGRPGSYNLTLQVIGAPAVAMATPVLVVP